VAEAVEAWGSRVARSLDLPVAPDEDDTVIVDLLGHEDVGYERVDAKTVVDRLMPAIDRRARTILSMRYQDDLLQSEIAAAVGVSQMHVSRVLSSSLERLTAYAATLEAHLQPA